MSARSLNLTIQDALLHRLKWASLHWRATDVASEAWPHFADAVAERILASDWLAAHDAEVRAAERERVLREVADEWTQGAWSNVMLPKPTPPAVPVIAYANRMGDWLRDRAAKETDQ